MTALPCGCCEPWAPLTPLAVVNRAGLDAIAYRVGTYASFRETMLEDIAHAPELARLTTREDDDYAVTILDLWAAVGDVLTFYQERYANEAFLRTATQRQSIGRLARLIDYSLRPGRRRARVAGVHRRRRQAARRAGAPARAERARAERAPAGVRDDRGDPRRRAPEPGPGAAAALRRQPARARAPPRRSCIRGSTAWTAWPASRRATGSSSTRRARRAASRS